MSTSVGRHRKRQNGFEAALAIETTVCAKTYGYHMDENVAHRCCGHARTQVVKLVSVSKGVCQVESVVLLGRGMIMTFTLVHLAMSSQV